MDNSKIKHLKLLIPFHVIGIVFMCLLLVVLFMNYFSRVLLEGQDLLVQEDRRLV